MVYRNNELLQISVIPYLEVGFRYFEIPKFELSVAIIMESLKIIYINEACV